MNSSSIDIGDISGVDLDESGVASGGNIIEVDVDLGDISRSNVQCLPPSTNWAQVRSVVPAIKPLYRLPRSTTLRCAE